VYNGVERIVIFMAANTPATYRNLVFYQVFVRQHTPSGTFRELISDLDRIRDLGVDVVYLLPIHPIGEKNRKGSLGSPYAIEDYRKINPEYGMLEDFQDLIRNIHDRNMKLMIDVVYNHTSPDSRLIREHPEWFFRNEKGEFANRVGDWSDIRDFDFSKERALWEELIDTLVYWTTMGVDGFRCDVAPLLPIEFWLEARKKVEQVHPGCLWLTESVHIGFIKYLRDRGFEACSDSEMYQAFDICYDYDIFDYLIQYLNGERPIQDYLSMVKNQEGMYPKNYVKLRNLENHDQARVASYITRGEKLVNLTAALFFLKGATMIYAGQEAVDDNRPDLFESDKVNWSNYNAYSLADMMKKLIALKKDDAFATGVFQVHLSKEEMIHISYESADKKIVGMFNLSDRGFAVKSELPNGTYQNYLTGKEIRIKEEIVRIKTEPIVLIHQK